jgi:mannan endo-1,4-beta-mannosidase
MLNKSINIFILISILILTGSLSYAEDSFVSVLDNQFFLGNEPFYYSGTNNYYLSYFAQDDNFRPMVDEVLSEAKNMGLTVIRTWAFNDGGWNQDGYPDSWALQTSPGVYNEDAFKGLDYALYKADAMGLKIIGTFVNNWDDYGGMNWYNSYSASAYNHDDFYTDVNTKSWYKDHVNTILNRTNTYNGKVYKDDPTIMAWELANEARATSDVSGDKLQSWIEEMSAYVKSVDSKHLLTTGVEGFYANNGSGWHSNGYTGTDFIRNHSVSNIDFATLHLYADGWNWDLTESLAWIEQHIQECDDILNMPLVLEEFGKLLPVEDRDYWYGQFYALIEQAAQEGRSVAGDNFWMLEANNSGHNDGYSLIYPNDISTINIIMEHAETMNNTVPEPSSLVLLFLGAIGMHIRRKYIVV